MTSKYSLGARIKFRRKQLKLSQEELAEKLYVTRQMITNYENDNVDIKLSVLYEIAEALKVSPLWLLLPIWERATEENVEDIAYDGAIGIKIMYSYFDLPQLCKESIEARVLRVVCRELNNTRN